MSMVFRTDPSVQAQVVSLVLSERVVSLSKREWKHRLAGYGYAIKDTDSGRQVVTTLPHGVEVCALPPDWAS